MILLGFDTATPATAVALWRPGHDPREARHDPAPGERPGHAAQVLTLARGLLDEAGLAFADLDRIAVGTGPGTFTGLRIGVATARALAQATGARLVGVPTLRTLAAAVPDYEAVLAVVDARRGEAFVAGYVRGEEAIAPAAMPPEGLAALPAPPSASAPSATEASPRSGGGHLAWLAVGDGAVRFRSALERAGSTVPPDDAPLHRISAVALCRLAAQAPGAAEHAAVVPEYLRLPDAELTRRPS